MTDVVAPSRVLMPEDLRRPPRFATRRNPELRTRGGKIAVLAAEMGRPLMPHQQYIADVATELNPPGSRLRYRYQTVVISLPRQTGKTTLMRPIFLERVLARPGTQAFMTAQLGKDAAARWEDLVGDLEHSPLFRSFTRIKRGKGDQRALFPNGSYIAPFAPTRDSLHGYSPQLAFVDEGWAFSLDGGEDLMRAVRPAQITKTDRQLFVVSAAGDQTSEWWNALVEAGRAAVAEPASNPGMAYLEWSMDENLDPYDPASWEFHPGLDGLITTDDLAQEAKPESNSHGDFLRGFMNVPTKVRDNTVVDLDTFDALHDTHQAPPAPERVVYAYDVAIDRTAASVWAAWVDAAGRVQLHVVETRDGADWLPEFIAARQKAGAAAVFAADDGGPARITTDVLRRAGHRIETLNGRDAATAWGAFKAHVKDGTLRHDGSAALRGALEVAVEQPAGDSVALSRRKSLAPIDPLVAAAVAAWHAARISPVIQVF